MPAATALGDAATQALRAFGAAGGRVLVCGPGVTRDADGLPRQQPAALDAARLDLAPLLETAAADDGTEGGRERRARAVASCLDPLRALLPAPTMEMLGRPLPWLAFLYRHPGYYVLHVVNVGPAAVDDCAEDGAHAAGVLSLQLRLPERLDTAIRFAPRGRSEGRTLSPTRTADGCRLDLELDRTAPYLLVQLPVPKP